MSKKEILSFKTNVLLKSIIGKDLITDDNIAVLELVKNSFDAHSKKVNVLFENIVKNNDGKVKNPTAQSSKIIIQDFGTGMSLTDIKDKWLNIAYSEKKGKREELGRVMAGNKGIGRFSCDRLGKFLTIYTRKKGQPYVRLDIDWSKFELEDKQNLQIQNVKLHSLQLTEQEFLNTTNHSRFTSGTILEMSVLRSKWDRAKILGLRKHLEKLINPNQAFKKDNFQIRITADEFMNEDRRLQENERVNGLVENKIFEKLNFKTTSIESFLSNDGKYISTVLNDKGRKIFTLKEKNHFRALKDIRITLYYLSTVSKIFFTRQTGVRGVDFGSVFLFINGFRVPPYGDEGDDWLGIEIRKGQGQKRYLGTRDIIGRIEIWDELGSFKIISNREGLVKEGAYLELTASEKPYGFFYKTFRRLERFVVEGLNWDSVNQNDKDLERQINDNPKWDETEKIFKESSLDKDRRILQRVLNIIDAKKGDILTLDINNKFAKDIIDKEKESAKRDLDNLVEELGKTNYTTEQIDNVVKKLQERKVQLEEFHKKVGSKRNAVLNNNYQSSLGEIESMVGTLEEKVSELQELRSKLEKENNERAKLEEELRLEKEKNTYLRATRRHMSDDAEGLIHNIKIVSKEISNNVELLIEKAKNNGLKQTELLRRLAVIKFNAEKALKTSSLVTRANFKTQAQSQIVDIPKYIVQYVKLLEDVYEHQELIFTISVCSVEFVRKVSVLELSIIIDDLVSNAKKAGAKEMRCDFMLSGKGLSLVFSDNGRGLNKSLMENPDQIFDLGITTTEGGSGIGMYSVRMSLKKMNADIRFIGNGIKLKGASFEILFK